MIQTDYTFASAGAMLAGEALLHERWPGRYQTHAHGLIMQATGGVDAEGLPVFEDAGYGYVLCVFDTQSDDPVPGWEDAHLPSDVTPHTWAHHEYQRAALDDEAPATPTPIEKAALPDDDEVDRIRADRERRRSANAEIQRLLPILAETRARVDEINERIQTKLPERRDRVIARIDVRVARLGTMRADRDAQVAIAQDTKRSREDREAAREAVETIRESIEATQAQLDADRVFRAGYADLLAEVRARRDELVARRAELFEAVQQARAERQAALAALEGQ